MGVDLYAYEGFVLKGECKVISAKQPSKPRHKFLALVSIDTEVSFIDGRAHMARFFACG